MHASALLFKVRVIVLARSILFHSPIVRHPVRSACEWIGSCSEMSVNVMAKLRKNTALIGW